MSVQGTFSRPMGVSSAQPPRAPRPLLEPLEPRLLLSAGVGELLGFDQFGGAEGPPAQDAAQAVDRDGNVYVAGDTRGALPGQELADPLPGPVIVVDVSDQMTQPSGVITIDSRDIVPTTSAAFLASGFNGNDYYYTMENPWTWSLISIAGAPDAAPISSVNYVWDVDFNLPGNIEHFVKKRGPDSWTGPVFTDMAPTGDDDGWGIGFLWSSHGNKTVYPEIGTRVNGTWEFSVGDTTGMHTGIYGRIDSWLLQIFYETQDLMGSTCFAPSSIPWGGEFVVQGGVQNAGSLGVSCTFTQEFYLSNDTTWGDADDVLLGAYTHSADVPAGGFGPDFIKVLTLPSAPPSGYSATGTCYIGMKTDADRDVPFEVWAANNGPGDRSQGQDWDAFTLSPRAELNDRGDGWSSFNPDSVCAGLAWSASFDIRNSGTADSGAFDVDFYASTDSTIDAGDDFFLGRVTVPSITTGSSGTAALHLTSFPSGIPFGDYYVGTIIDPTDAVDEWDESNNTGVDTDDYPLTLGPPVDLRDRGDTFSSFNPDTVASPGAPLVGDPWDAYFDISNGGTAASGSFDVDFYASTDALITTRDHFLGRVTMSSIAGGAYATAHLRLKPFPSGIPFTDYYVGIRIDPGNAVAEFNETNNLGVDMNDYPLTVIIPPRDLRGYECNVPESTGWGDTFTVQGRVKNYGLSWVTGTFTQEFYLSNDTTWGDADDVLLGSYTHTADVQGGPGALPGPRFSKSLTLPSVIPGGYSATGTYYIGMKTDALDDIPETDETNNGPGDRAMTEDWDSFMMLPSISIDDVTMAEGDSGTKTFTFWVGLSYPSDQTVTVDYATAGATATTPEDYTAASGTVTFDPGKAVRPIRVTVIGDTKWEPDETFHVNLSSPLGATISDGQGIGTIENDDEGIPPTVVDVLVAGAGWDEGFLDFLAAEEMGVGGYSIPVGSPDQLDELPWVNVDQVKIAFSEDVDVEQGDLGVYGVHTPQYATNGFAYDSNTFTATWTLGGALEADKLLLVLDDAVQDGAGNALDGEWANAVSTYPSGDGAAGGDFRFRFNALPGDVDQSGEVRSSDTIKVRRRSNTVPGDADYSVFYDVDGSGDIRASDTIKVRRLSNSDLPPGEPVAPPAAPLGGRGGDYELIAAALRAARRTTDRDLLSPLRADVLSLAEIVPLPI